VIKDTPKSNKLVREFPNIVAIRFSEEATLWLAKVGCTARVAFAGTARRGSGAAYIKYGATSSAATRELHAVIFIHNEIKLSP